MAARAKPRTLYADVLPGDPTAVVVYRPAVREDQAGEPRPGIVTLRNQTEDGLSMARRPTPWADRMLVFQAHESPALAAWFAADRKAQAGRQPSPPVARSALDEWKLLRRHHAGALPERPTRKLRGPPRWS